jgi:hypothetical protein
MNPNVNERKRKPNYDAFRGPLKRQPLFENVSQSGKPKGVYDHCVSKDDPASIPNQLNRQKSLPLDSKIEVPTPSSSSVSVMSSTTQPASSSSQNGETRINRLTHRRQNMNMVTESSRIAGIETIMPCSTKLEDHPKPCLTITLNSFAMDRKVIGSAGPDSQNGGEIHDFDDECACESNEVSVSEESADGKYCDLNLESLEGVSDSPLTEKKKVLRDHLRKKIPNGISLNSGTMEDSNHIACAPSTPNDLKEEATALSDKDDASDENAGTNLFIGKRFEMKDNEGIDSSVSLSLSSRRVSLVVAVVVSVNLCLALCYWVKVYDQKVLE